MDIQFQERTSFVRATGSEYEMTDSTGASYRATVRSGRELAPGLVHMDLEINPDPADPQSLRFAEPASGAGVNGEEEPRPCPKREFVGNRVRQCILEDGHLGLHQYDL